MKLCLICAVDQESDAHTCLNCGGMDFAPSREAAPVETPIVDAASVDAVEDTGAQASTNTQASRKRGK